MPKGVWVRVPPRVLNCINMRKSLKPLYRKMEDWWTYEIMWNSPKYRRDMFKIFRKKTRAMFKRLTQKEVFDSYDNRRSEE